MNALKLQLALGASLAALALSVSAQTTAPKPAMPEAKTAGPSQADIKRADKNGDGKLSREEAAALPELASKFTMLDKDGDGSLSSGELAGASGDAASK